jgi:hypothetical protein
MKKQKLAINVGIESSSEEIKIVQEAFSEGFDVGVENTYCRLSEGELGMAILVGFLEIMRDGAIFSLVMAGISKVLKDTRWRREPCVTLRTKKWMISFTRSGVTIQNQKEFKKFNSIKAFEVYMKELDKK